MSEDYIIKCFLDCKGEDNGFQLTLTNKAMDVIANEIERLNKKIERLNNIINELEKTLNYDIDKSEEYMNKFRRSGLQQGDYPVHYYRAEWQKEKAIGYLDKLQGADKE